MAQTREIAQSGARPLHPWAGMRRNPTLTRMLLATSIVLPAIACDTDEGDGGDETQLRVVMQTPPTHELASPDVDPVDGITIDVEEIHVHEINGDWLILEPDDEYETIRFGDDPLVIADGYLPEGDYDQLRIVVADADITLGGETFPLDISSGDTSGLKIHGEFCVHEHADDDDDDDDDPEHVLYLSWDVGDVGDAGEGIRHSDQRGYWLVPSIQIDGAPGCGDHEHDTDDDGQ